MNEREALKAMADGCWVQTANFLPKHWHGNGVCHLFEGQHVRRSGFHAADWVIVPDPTPLCHCGKHDWEHEGGKVCATLPRPSMAFIKWLDETCHAEPSGPSVYGVKFLTKDLKSPLAGVVDGFKRFPQKQYKEGAWVPVLMEGSFFITTAKGFARQLRVFKDEAHIDPRTLRLVGVECRGAREAWGHEDFLSAQDVKVLPEGVLWPISRDLMQAIENWQSESQEQVERIESQHFAATLTLRGDTVTMRVEKFPDALRGCGKIVEAEGFEVVSKNFVILCDTALYLPGTVSDTADKDSKRTDEPCYFPRAVGALRAAAKRIDEAMNILGCARTGHYMGSHALRFIRGLAAAHPELLKEETIEAWELRQLVGEESK